MENVTLKSTECAGVHTMEVTHAVQYSS